ncbi:hypothetical protein GBQ13_00735 [Mycobacterium avium subsp. hominissuis]|nr:hypothetical protein [Mycobacterium avium subsp. hominissuis]
MAALNPNAAAAVRRALVDAEARDNLSSRVAGGPISRGAAEMFWGEPHPQNADTRDPLLSVILVDPASARPGDIAVFADHTAIVAGNGRLIGPSGQQHPTGPGVQGIFRPAQTVNKDANTNELKGVGEYDRD